MPTKNANDRSLIGSSIELNHSGLKAISGLLKKLVAITLTASPKKLPNINPQKVVDMPEKNISLTNFSMPGFIFLTLSNT